MLEFMHFVGFLTGSLVIFLLSNFIPVVKMFGVLFLFLLVAFFYLLISGDCSSCLDIVSYKRER